jgi:hypothetical protein
MENLIFTHRGRAWVKRIIGVFWILLGIFSLLFIYSKPLTLHIWITSIVEVLIGIIFFTPLVGNNETRLVVGDGNLKIKWATKISDIIIQDNEIEKIILKDKKIEILRKEKKAVGLWFERWELVDKRKIYEFMIEYAGQRNIVLEK